MRRRELVVGAAGLAALAGGAYTHRGGTIANGRQPAHDPITFETVAGDSITVPDPERPLFVDRFATTCRVCREQLPALRTAAAELGDAVAFVSITAEQPAVIDDPTIRTWWDDHGGPWPVVRDDDWSFARHYRQATPTAVLFDAAGRIRWEHTGRKSADQVIERGRAVA